MRWGAGWPLCAKILRILPASTPPLYRLEKQWYSKSSLSIIAVSTKVAKSTSPLLLRKYPPVDFAAMTGKIRISNP